MQSESPDTNFFSPVRACVLFAATSVGLIGLIGRVAYLQTYGRQQTVLRAERQHHQSETLPARRGSIFDTNGALLACTIQNEGVFVDPMFMHERYQEEGRSLVDMDTAITKLAHLLDRDSLELSQLIADNSEERFLKLSDGVDERTAAEIEKLKIFGVGMVPVNQRVYPMGSFAAHIIGGVGKDQNGLDGVELKYNKILAGRDGYQRTLKDARRRGIGVSAEDYVPPEHGSHLVLTIDANIQTIVEQELQQACEEFKAKRGEVVVMDPWTGDVLALANYPTFSPQQINESSPEARTNNALVAPYEPGSAIKPFIVGPALQQGVTRPGEVWPINGLSWATHYGRRISDTHGYGPLTTWDVLVKSSNIGMSMLAERMENPRLYAALTGFAFGRRTGIELPGEDPGLVRALGKWSSHSTESVAQGYELMVTPLQLAHAFCAYANGGRLPEVRVLRGVVDDKGQVISSRPHADYGTLPVVIDPQAAMKVRRILADVPLRGTASSIKTGAPNWYVWNIFGKTGTAHISEGRAGYSAHRYNSTFLGGAPFEKPRLVIAMTLHDPGTAAHYGGAVSGPASARILTRSLAYLQVDPSPELDPPPADIAAHLVRFVANVYHKPTTQPADQARDHTSPSR
jgi:cell division protein FtsI (penicillin-binding protein 3)